MHFKTLLACVLAGSFLVGCAGDSSENGDIHSNDDRSQVSNPDSEPDPEPTPNPDPDPDPTPDPGGDGLDPTPNEPEPEPEPDPDPTPEPEPEPNPVYDLTYFRQDLNQCNQSDQWLINQVAANNTLPSFYQNMEQALYDGKNVDGDIYPDYVEQAIVLRIECDTAKGVLNDNEGDYYVELAEWVLYHRIRELDGNQDYLGSPVSLESEDRDRQYFQDLVKLIDDMLWRVTDYRTKMIVRHSYRNRLHRLYMDGYCNADADNCVLDQFVQSEAPPSQFDFKLTFGGNTGKSNVIAFLPGPNVNAHLGMHDLRYLQEEVGREGLETTLRNISNAVGGKVSYQYWHTELEQADWSNMRLQIAPENILQFGRAWFTARKGYPQDGLTLIATEMPMLMDAVYAEYADRYLQRIEAAIGGGASSISIVAYGWGADFAARLEQDIPAKYADKVKILSVAPLVSASLAGDGSYCALRNDKMLNDLRPLLQSIPEGNVSASASSYSNVNHDFGTAYLSLDNPRNCILNFLSQSIVIPDNDSNPIVDNINGRSNGVVVPYNRILDLIIGSPDTLSPRENPEFDVVMNMLMEEPGTSSTHYGRDGLGLFGWWWEDNERNQSRDYWNRYWLNYGVNRGGSFCWRPDPNPNRVQISDGVTSPSFLFILRTPTEEKKYVWKYDTNLGVGAQGCVVSMEVYAIGQNGNLYRYDDAREPLNAIHGYVGYVRVSPRARKL